MRFLNRRRIQAALGILTILVLSLVAAFDVYLRSPAFEARVRKSVIQQLEQTTGASVSLKNFTWSFWERRIRIDDLTLRGSEPPEDDPLARINHIEVGINLRTLLQRRVDLFELTVYQPEFHVIVGPDGRTNFPSRQMQQQPMNFRISIENFNVLNGSALLNEQRVPFDLSLTNLVAALKYEDAREVLEANLSYDGVLDRAPDVRRPIPYSFSGKIDYTRETVLAHQIVVRSGKSELRLQGRVNQVLSKSISGRLAYSGNAQARFLNYFFTEEVFDGNADAEGSLEFTAQTFSTQGKAKSQAIDLEGWHATAIEADYAYRFPERRVSVSKFDARLADGTISGEATVENLPGPSRVIVSVDYTGVDAPQMSRAFPWDKRYRITSKASGKLAGWFEGKLARFDFAGHLDLASYQPPFVPGSVPLPVDGSTDYQLQPGSARVSNANLRFYSSTLQADGLIDQTMSNLKVNFTSSNLKDAAFLYSDANGSGSFNGTLSGAIAQPVLDGEFTVQNHLYRQWTMQQVTGGVLLDLRTENAVLKNVRITQGESQILVNGNAALSGSPVDLRVQSTRVTAQDVRPFIGRDIGGTFAGEAHVTSLRPNIAMEGALRAAGLSYENHFVGNVRAQVRYVDPEINLEQVSIEQNGSTLSGSASFNRATEALKFTARMSSVDLQTLHDLGLPDAVKGVIRQAEIQGSGTISSPNLKGNALLQNLAVNVEFFPEARVDLASTGTKLDVSLETGRSFSLKGQIDMAAQGYPYTARANFTQYPLEHVAKFSEGTLAATGIANLSGVLTDPSRLRGEGRIESAEIRVRQISARTTQPFTFDLNTDELTLNDVALMGPSTQLHLTGTIGLTERAPLNLSATGQINLGLISAEYPEFVSDGSMDVRMDVRGTAQAPDFRGLAVLTNASLSRPGLFTSLTNLKGTLLFNQDQIRLNDMEGRVGGGTVRAQGTAMIQAGNVQGMNIEIEATNVRLRGYPEGLRAVVNGKMVLRGTVASPLLEGDIQIQSLAYRSNFEDFLALLSQENVQRNPKPFGRTRLSLHVEGGKNITIQNQLAEVEARVDIDSKGTIDEPSITGHIESSGGTLTFRGNRYTVTRGNIDFVDPLSIQPVMDIEAESQVRDYLVILSITGKGDNPKLSLRSEPPLPELEIVSLIAGGSTRDEIAARSPTVPTSEKLFQSGAASILFDLLQQRVGNRLGLLGSGKVRIDPFLVGAENNPAARITVSEQVTKDLSITYSQDLSSNRQQVITIEYFVSRNTSVVASRDELGNFGLDVRHRTRIK